MPLLEKLGKTVIVLGRKHCGKTLEEVAREDPNYLVWLRTGDRLANAPDDVFFKLVRVMEIFDIPVSRKRNR